MFGLIGLITQGWVNKWLDKEEELYQQRSAICRQCPLYTEDSLFKGKCDLKKCIDTKTGEIKHAPGKDIVCGCGCAISAAARVKDKECVLKKW